MSMKKFHAIICLIQHGCIDVMASLAIECSTKCFADFQHTQKKKQMTETNLNFITQQFNAIAQSFLFSMQFVYIVIDGAQRTLSTQFVHIFSMEYKGRQKNRGDKPSIAFFQLLRALFIFLSEHKLVEIYEN